MPTNTVRLKNAMKAAMVANIPSPTQAQLDAFETTAQAMASAIITEITSLTITTLNPTGLISAAPSSPVTGALLYTLS